MSNSEKVFHEFIKIIGNKDGKFRKLLVYADKLLRLENISGRAITAEDIISELITKIAYGERAWDPETKPDLYNYLFLLIRSQVNNLAFIENWNIKPPTVKHQHAEERFFQRYVEQHCKKQHLTIDEVIELKDLTFGCLRYFKDDTIASLVLVGLCEGMQRKDISEDGSISLQGVDTAIKRIRRKLRETLKKEHDVKIIPDNIEDE